MKRRGMRGTAPTHAPATIHRAGEPLREWSRCGCSRWPKNPAGLLGLGSRSPLRARPCRERAGELAARGARHAPLPAARQAPPARSDHPAASRAGHRQRSARSRHTVNFQALRHPVDLARYLPQAVRGGSPPPRRRPFDVTRTAQSGRALIPSRQLRCECIRSRRILCIQKSRPRSGGRKSPGGDDAGDSCSGKPAFCGLRALGVSHSQRYEGAGT